MEKWWRKTPLKQQSDGKKRHHISNCGGILTTTYHIQDEEAPDKTKNNEAAIDLAVSENLKIGKWISVVGLEL